MLPGPGLYTLYGENFKKTKDRAKYLLERLYKEKIVSEDKKKDIISEIDDMDDVKAQVPESSFIVDSIWHEIDQKQAKGLKTIETSLCKNFQTITEKTIRAINTEDTKSQVMVLVTKPKTNEIVALAGSQSFKKDQYNRVYRMRRPVGSLVKPFVYWLAFDHNSDLEKDSTLIDKPITIEIVGAKNWTPSNYDRKFEDEVELQAALFRSRNVPTVWLAKENNLLEPLSKLLKPVSLNQKPVWSWVLGTVELTPMEVSSLYGLFYSDSISKPKVVSKLNYTLRTKNYSPAIEKHQTELNFSNGYKVKELLKNTVNTDGGTAKTAFASIPENIRKEISGKTGTTTNGRDSWFAAMVNDYLFLCWQGVEEKGSRLTGASGAAQICRDIIWQVPKY